MGLGPDVSVLAPAELCEAVGAEARNALAAYPAAYPATSTAITDPVH